jgi:hypothetical protein
MVSSNTRERRELVLLILNAKEPKHASASLVAPT